MCSMYCFSLVNFSFQFSPLTKEVGAAEHRDERHDRSSPSDDSGVRVLGANVGHAPDGFSLHVYRLAPHDELEVLQHTCRDGVFILSKVFLAHFATFCIRTNAEARHCINSSITSHRHAPRHDNGIIVIFMPVSPGLSLSRNLSVKLVSCDGLPASRTHPILPSCPGFLQLPRGLPSRPCPDALSPRQRCASSRSAPEVLLPTRCLPCCRTSRVDKESIQERFDVRVLRTAIVHHSNSEGMGLRKSFPCNYPFLEGRASVML